MKSELKRIEGEVIRFYDLSKALERALTDNDFDEIVQKVNQRENILSGFERNNASLSQLADNKSSHKLESIMNSIINLDKKNMEVLNTKIKNLTAAIADLARERDAIKNLRSVARHGQKQLVDFLY